MGSLPPSRAREFEERIMVSRGGIEYMAGGTESHPTIRQRALVGKCKSNSNSKTKIAGEEESQKQEQPRPLTPTPTCALTTPISSYMVHAFDFLVAHPKKTRIRRAT